ncbi:MAG: OmpA family protein [Ilumatobacter sp.]|nr:OmpA family protein [Ilumatobacter sp.]
MASPVRRDTRRYRRRILAICAAITTIAFVVTAPIYLDRVESDLETRVPDELAAAGFTGLTASFSGQDGTLSCDSPLADPEAARQAAYDVWGVRAVELDRSCRVNTGDDGSSSEDTTPAETVSTSVPDTAASSTTTTVPTDPAFATVADAVVGSPQLSLLAVLLQESGLIADFGDPSAEPVTLFAATDDAFEALPADVLAEIREDPDVVRALVLHHTTPGRLVSADFTTGPLVMSDDAELDLIAEVPSLGGALLSVVDIEAGNGVVHMLDAVLFPDDLAIGATSMAEVGMTFDGASARLSGTVATEAIRVGLVDAVADGITVADELGVDPDTGVGAANAERVTTMVASVTAQLSDGVVTFDGVELSVTGNAPDEASRDVVAAVAAEADAATELTVTAVEPPDEPEPDPAVGLETILNTYVGDNPILFQPGSALLTDDSGPVLDQVARIIAATDAVVVTVEGHTDSDGVAEDNLVLSRFRALAVQRALLERGVPAEMLDSEGFGSEQPILVDGVEDKEASRRVEFRVVTVS